MNPELVTPSNFPEPEIIYDVNGFAIAIGTWFGEDDEESPLTIAMRWNESPTDIGYPKVFNHPMWFIVAPELRKLILEGLLSSTNLTSVRRERIEAILQEIG